MLKKKIEEDMKSAMKAKEGIRLSALRMLRADIVNTEIKLGKKELEDAEVIKVLQRQVKQRQDSIEQFRKGNRQDLVDKEAAELKVLESYMPEMLSPEEIRKMAEEAIRELEATSKKDMGRVMKAVLEKARGKADAKAASEIVKELLP